MRNALRPNDAREFVDRINLRYLCLKSAKPKFGMLLEVRHDAVSARPCAQRRRTATSGENLQDNDLAVVHDANAASKFEAHFARMWSDAQPIRALESQ